MARFFKIAVIALLVSLLGVSCATQPEAEAPVKAETSVQLYNFRDLINTPEGYAANHEDVFSSLAEMGYTSVEAAGYGNGQFYGVSPEQFRADVEAAGLEVLSSHTMNGLTPKELRTGDFSQSLAWWDQCIADHKTAGMKYIVCPAVGIPSTLKELKTVCDYLNAIGKKCAEQGILFGYHSHSHEFVEVEGQVAYDYMIQNTDPDCVFFQMDVYWAVMGKASPVAYFEKYPGRFKMLHIKDDYDLGQSGMVGFDAIFRNFDLAGTKDIVVEEEAYPTDDWKASLKADIDYLNWLRSVLK